MKTRNLTITAALTAILLAAPGFAQEASPGANASPAANPMEDPAMMAKMMEMAKPNDNHKLLASMDGSWNYTVKMWMNGDPSTPPDVSKGTAIRKTIMDGRYVVMDVKGKMEMPGQDGKPKSFTFLGRGTEGYDNAKQKFIGSWIDNMGTGIMMSEGTYDPSTKTFTYNSESEPVPGMKYKVREELKLESKNQMTMNWFEDHGGKEVKTMEIDYTRAK